MVCKTHRITSTLLICAIFIVSMFVCGNCFAERKHSEKWYQAKWCHENGGREEAVLADRTRWDCLTNTHAIEFDFGNKWAEAIGQSLYYSLQTGKKAGIVLILESSEDYRYWIRLNSTIKHFNLPIDTWIVRGETQ